MIINRTCLEKIAKTRCFILLVIYRSYLTERIGISNNVTVCLTRSRVPRVHVRIFNRVVAHVGYT